MGGAYPVHPVKDERPFSLFSVFTIRALNVSIRRSSDGHRSGSELHASPDESAGDGGADCARSGGSAFYTARLQAMSAVYKETDAAGAVSDITTECL